jgi:hypothetical protein
MTEDDVTGGLENRDRDARPVLLEDLGHADFFGDETQLEIHSVAPNGCESGCSRASREGKSEATNYEKEFGAARVSQEKAPTGADYG